MIEEINNEDQQTVSIETKGKNLKGISLIMISSLQNCRNIRFSFLSHQSRVLHVITRARQYNK